jgi:hypothetical protein
MMIDVTFGAWLAHVAKVDTWDSRAYLVATTYRRCKPIAPEVDDGATTDLPGFMPMPTDLWVAHGMPANAPALVDVPAYGASAYREVGAIAKPSAFDAFDGRAVRVATEFDATDGVLLGKTLFTLVDGAYGARGLFSIERIARLELKPKARLKAKLAYGKVLGYMTAVAAGASCKGTRVELTLRLPYDGAVPDLTSKSQILKLLARPLVGHQREPQGDSPLAQALRADAARLGESYVKLANGYIASFALGKAKRAKVPDLDALPLEQVRAYLAKPRPTTVLTIEVTDKAWIAHLADADPFAVDGYWVEEPIEWTEKPRRWLTAR